MNRTIVHGLSVALILSSGIWTGCGILKPNVIVATSGGSQTATLTTAFSKPLVATVRKGNKPVAGVTVKFSAPSTGATAVFSNGSSTYTATTGADGTASASITANSTSGSYTITATAPATTTTSTSATFSLQNTGSIYAFYLNGLEALNVDNIANYYALAGSVVLDSNGNVITGEEDYNDGNGLTATDVSITGGTLTLNSSGTGTLTLKTGNNSLGVSGTETLAIQFVNTSHGLIAQFDGSATSSGTIDAQNLTSAPSGSYAFTVSGVDPENYNAYDAGGVIVVSGTSFTANVDVNDAGEITFGSGNTVSGTVTAPDILGRGGVSGLSVGGTPITVQYYVVGPEVLRLIVVDTAGSALGSAFGQGTSTLSDTAIANSIFALFGNPYASTPYILVGQLNTSQAASPSTFSALGDFTEGFNVFGGVYTPRALSGPYAVSDGANGYGDLTIAQWPTSIGSTPCTPSFPYCWSDPPLTQMGLYTVDPKLNLTDPNNTTSGLGGALVADMDEAYAGGTGIVVPQSDTNTADFTGTYNFGWQAVSNGGAFAAGEFDFVGQGAVTSSTDTNLTPNVPEFVVGSTTTELNDVFGAFVSGAPATYPAATISAPLEADASNAGRYTLDYNQQSTEMSITPGTGINPLYFGIVAYQGSGSLVFWSEQDSYSLSFGILEAPGSLTGLPISSSERAVVHSSARTRNSAVSAAKPQAK